MWSDVKLVYSIKGMSRSMRGLCSNKHKKVSKVSYSGKRNGLRIASLNIVSLRKYKDELGTILNDNEIDVIGLNETRLDGNIDDRWLRIEATKYFVMTVTFTVVEWQFM